MSHVRTFPEVQVDAFVRRQVLSENENLMVVSFSFEKDGEGALHSHPHIQSTYVESGAFTFSIDGEKFDVKAGDSFVIPSNAVHGCTCHETGRLVDTFTPRRDDFL
ncbi:cupin domain-containing protein [Pacificibacter marinus]|uniref:Cupin domain protein n=1 Tax=Pacificibacter marinus TaxID=658057 RepID=A0A1Y5RTB7_9RHOB|nr:cupin domain-containing protein [Pacificibacter marinus]SEK43234.1 Cupin domain protein [Pacificibacter marinus]SLN23764.1 Cupin domain protein [Pacificibacter marinus]